jgi:hypothetical protein
LVVQSVLVLFYYVLKNSIGAETLAGPSKANFIQMKPVKACIAYGRIQYAISSPIRPVGISEITTTEAREQPETTAC